MLESYRWVANVHAQFATEQLPFEPPKLVGYPCLRHLELGYYVSNDPIALPTWFPELT